MKADKKRESGFYWVRFEGEPVVAEYVTGFGCTDTSTGSGTAERPHWHIPGSDGCFYDPEVWELLSGRLQAPRIGLVHAHDKIFKANQKTVTATCGLIARPADTVFAPSIPSVFDSKVTCVGCKAILREREKEAQRAATPGRHKADKADV
jgi:hypothetical protein